MYDLGRHIANIKSAIKAKQAPIKVAQTRLELRSHRPNGEATKDMPQIRFAWLHLEGESRCVLQAHPGDCWSANASGQTKLQACGSWGSAENAEEHQKTVARRPEYQGLYGEYTPYNYSLLLQATSLVIDRQKCMAIRLNFPYHTRCVCTAAKDDENQVKIFLFLVLGN